MLKQIPIAFLSFCLFAIACHEKKPEPMADKKFVLSDTMAKMIQLDTVGRGFIHDELILSGEVSFNENNVSKIYPRNSGQVVECKVSLGDPVHAGQVLAVLHSADIAGNYADLSSANADIAITKRELESTTSLYNNGIASEKEMTTARQNYEKALAAKTKIQSLISINGGKGSSAGGTYQLVSPINGYIVEKKVNAGFYIRPDMGDNLFTISDLKTVWIYANVFEADIPKVKKGYDVTVTTIAYPNKPLHGVIDQVSEVLDPTNKTLRVRIILPNPDLMLRPEMYAKVLVTNKENRQSLYVPNKSIVSLNGKNYVIVFHSNADMKIVEVNVLKSKDNKTYVTGNIQAGDQIITKNELLIFQQLLNESE